MAEFDDVARRLSLKVVYYGPALSGKTSNLVYLHDHLRPELKGDIMTLETKGDRTLFFDLLPIGITAPSGLLIKLRVFTVPGQVAHDSTRKAVLSRADGVVFVADSQISQGANNAQSFQNLADNAARVGLHFEAMPVTVQFNKRDLPNIQSEEEVAARWSRTPWPVVFAVATNGMNVLETFRTVLSGVYSAADKEFDLSGAHGMSAPDFVRAATGCGDSGA